MPLRFRHLVFAAAPLFVASPAAAQISGSASYQFLEAIRNDKGSEVDTMLAKAGSRIIDTQDPTTGDTALHIVVRRGDARYVRYLTGREEDANIKNNAGDTPLILAIDRGYTELVPLLLTGGSTAKSRANPNLPGQGGQTPLIKAVLRHDETMVRALLDAGADPDRRDYGAGKSARDYANEDARYPAIAKIFATTAKKVRRGVSGPTL